VSVQVIVKKLFILIEVIVVEIDTDVLAGDKKMLTAIEIKS